ncbi:bifunctional isocitrate dehydrogenase kinase/phosphatase [Dokdonella sp. MW10]|uniref:bifunctional isocitrate dehydrogenase kinase/phosphatase n=1 Tax=Dokdonella sp. MW10 TaxID=2992926 RepID=UPI003F7F98F3
MHERAAALILDAFLDYNARFSDITRRAQRRFERRDWKYARVDAAARIDLYDVCIRETLGRLELLLDERVRSRPLWAAMRGAFEALVEPMLDRELTKTFFNSLSRRHFRTTGVEVDIEFVALDLEPTANIVEPVAVNAYDVDGDLRGACARLLADVAFANGYADATRCADALAEACRARAEAGGWGELVAIEVLRTVFYRERRAYLVGRVRHATGVQPFVAALVSQADGARVDALLTEIDHVSVLFGYTRSYFHADLPTIGDTVVFLASLLPHKPVEEIYTVLGRAKQGKTERFRHLFRHLAAHPEERLVRAEGERGMVMAVFTPRGYPLVFKVIRDQFAYPKDMARRHVEEKYRLVFRYDRVGRLVDAQEFRHLRFPRAQFDDAILDELLAQCAESVGVDGDEVLVRHCYVQRRLRPMNLYVREMPPEAATRAMLDYGQAIKDLARSNIFPGDLLLKNFGITRGGRAIFYDYDELCLLEACRFRRVPEARDEDETRPLEEWLTVREGDVFPEMFPRFLGVPAALRTALVERHGEIFDPAWWSALQDDLARGGYGDVPPYPSHLRLPP